jgi:RNA polymerase sigma factor (sigma-70 family)
MSENYADESVALLLQALRLQNPDAASELWGRYFEQLRKVARRRLGPEHAAPFDSEDVALSAFHGFCQAMHQGRYPELADRDELWGLLVQITWRKARDYLSAETTQKRSVPRDVIPLESLPDNSPPPDIDAMTAEECQQLLQSLQDVDLVKVACLKLEGWTNEAIADEMKYTRRTIQRMLKISEVPGRRRLTGRLRPDGK